MIDELNRGVRTELAEFFNHHHDKLLVTADKEGEPNIALMGTPRLQPDGTIRFEISDRVSITLKNIRENKSVLFLAYVPGQRARDYSGARIYARVTEITSSGEEFEAIKEAIRHKHGDEKANELVTTVTCTITKVRPVVDRGQPWNENPFEDGE